MNTIENLDCTLKLLTKISYNTFEKTFHREEFRERPIQFSECGMNAR